MITEIKKTYVCDLCKVTSEVQTDNNKPGTWVVVTTPYGSIMICSTCNTDSVTYKQLCDCAKSLQG